MTRMATVGRGIGMIVAEMVASGDRFAGPDRSIELVRQMDFDIGPRVPPHVRFERDATVHPRPADTYRANRGQVGKARRGQLPTVYDRETTRSLLRQTKRHAAGRWPGVGDPKAVAAWRRAETARQAREAAAGKPKRARAPRKSKGAA